MTDINSAVARHKNSIINANRLVVLDLLNVIRSHGGNTWAVPAKFAPFRQYWDSRAKALLRVGKVNIEFVVDFVNGCLISPGQRMCVFVQLSMPRRGTYYEYWSKRDGSFTKYVKAIVKTVQEMNDGKFDWHTCNASQRKAK